MKLSVELTDFYLDEEEDIIPALKHHIIAECVNKITKSIQDKVDKVIDKAVKDAINDTMNSVIKGKIEEFVKSGNVNGTYSNDKQMPIEEWLVKQFQSTAYNNLKDTVQSLAKLHVDNLKNNTTCNLPLT